MYKSGIMLMAVLSCMINFCGCRQECVTKNDSVQIPIILSSTSNRECYDNGTLNVREDGKACILAYWDNNRTYDANSVLVQYDDHSGIWPFYDISAAKTENSEKSTATILLLFHFDGEKHL